MAARAVVAVPGLNQPDVHSFASTTSEGLVAWTNASTTLAWSPKKAQQQSSTDTEIAHNWLSGLSKNLRGQNRFQIHF